MINFYNNLPIITIRRHSKHENFTKIHFYLIILKAQAVVVVSHYNFTTGRNR